MSRELIPDLLRRHAELRPRVQALASAERPGLTYGDWWARSSAAASALAAKGVTTGDRVALIGSNAHYEDVAVAYLAILLTGAAALPMASSQSRQELEQAITASAPRLVVICDRALDPAPSWRTTSCERPSSEPAIGLDLPALDPDDPAEVISTSGTTGLPRLVEATHANLSWDHDADPRFDQEPYHLVHALTLGTNIGQVALRSSLTRGHTVVALERFDVGTYARVASTLPMRETLLVPAMAAAIAAEGLDRDWVLPAVELVVVSGAATPPAVWQRLAAVFPNAKLLNAYTTTEAWPARTVAVVDPARPRSVGRPLDQQALEIRGDDGRRLPPFALGTVYLAHGTTPRREGGGAPPRIDRRWIETDDLGYVDDEGFLFIEDRRSDVITTGGYTVSTLEVESVLAQHPLVVETAVVALPHPVLGSSIAAFVLGPETLDVDEVLGLARKQLAPHKVPRIVRRRDALPRVLNGKVAKRILRDELLREQLTGDDRKADASPGTSELATIHAIWEHVLERPVAGVHESFFALGGDSLSALRVVSRIQDELAHDVPVERLLAASTIAEQAEVVSAALGRR